MIKEDLMIYLYAKVRSLDHELVFIYVLQTIQKSLSSLFSEIIFLILFVAYFPFFLVYMTYWCGIKISHDVVVITAFRLEYILNINKEFYSRTWIV